MCTVFRWTLAIPLVVLAPILTEAGGDYRLFAQAELYEIFEIPAPVAYPPGGMAAAIDSETILTGTISGEVSGDIEVDSRSVVNHGTIHFQGAAVVSEPEGIIARGTTQGEILLDGLQSGFTELRGTFSLRGSTIHPTQGILRGFTFLPIPCQAAPELEEVCAALGFSGFFYLADAVVVDEITAQILIIPQPSQAVFNEQGIPLALDRIFLFAR